MPTANDDITKAPADQAVTGHDDAPNADDFDAAGTPVEDEEPDQ